MLNWLYLGFLNTSVVSGVNRGSASWSFSAQDSQFDYLGAGDSVTLTYQTEISDRYGNKVRIPITISVVGTNDQPQIASGGSTYAYLTSPVGDVEQSVQVQGDGNLTFTDVDVHDAHTASVSGVTVSDGWTGMPDETTLLALLSLDPVSEPGATDTGNVAWHFASGSGLFSGLSLDQTATLNYTVEISDGHGGTLDQTITVSVTGVQAAPPANRAPSLNLPDVIVSSTNAAVAVAGLSVSDPDSNAYEQVTLIAGHGRLKVAPDSAGVSLSGNNGRAVTIYGSVADVNSALSGLTYQGLSGVRDDILVTASDGELRDQRTIAVVATEQSGTSGDDVINGAADSAKLEGLQGDDMITAGSGGDFIVGGAGNDTLTGGLGSDIFKFEANSGIDTVYNFSATGPTHDVLQFNSKIFSDWAHLLGATTQVGSDLEIVLDQSDKITLKNVAIANFTSSDAKFI
jgi:Ca2+-binding RTX toxin-like protein